LVRHHEIDVAIESMQKVQPLVERLAVVRLVDKTVKRSRRCAQPVNVFSLGEAARLESLPRFDRERPSSVISGLSTLDGA